MAKIHYTDLPSLAQWQKDSYVLLAIRSSDRVLGRIDRLIPLYHATTNPFQRGYLLADLFFTADHWLKCAQRREGVNRSREPAVSALYRAIVDRLCAFFQVTVNVLPRLLEKSFGRELTDHGQMLDVEWNLAKYLSRAEVEHHRLHFKNGLVYQWAVTGDGLALVLANSRYCAPPAEVRMPSGFAGFALSMSRDLYMAKHYLGEAFTPNACFYHSSYLAGQTVLCTGTMKVVNGRIQAINNFSGHYKPTLDHLVNVLQCLQMHGIDLTPIDVTAIQVLNGTRIQLDLKAPKVLALRGDWQRMQRHQDQHQALRQENEKERAKRFAKLPKVYQAMTRTNRALGGV